MQLAWCLASQEGGEKNGMEKSETFWRSFQGSCWSRSGGLSEFNGFNGSNGFSYSAVRNRQHLQLLRDSQKTQ